MIMIAAAVLASPSPSPSPAPQDPCGSIVSIVARPSITTGVCTVRDGRADLETGYTGTVTTGSAGGITVNYPQAVVRIGIAKHMDLSFTPPSYTRSSFGGTIASGSSDMNFGAKWELGYTNRALWGMNVGVTGVTGSPGFTAGGTQYTANFNWSYAVDSVFGVSGTLGFNSLVGTDTAGNYRSYGAFIPSVILTAGLPGPSQAFAEYAYFSHAGPGLGAKSVIDFGYQQAFGDHALFDVEYGFQPTVINGQKVHYIGAGLSLMN